MLYVGLTNIHFLLRYAIGRQGALRKPVSFAGLGALFGFSAFRFRVDCDWSGHYYQNLAAGGFDCSSIKETRQPIWWAILGWVRVLDLTYPRRM